MRYIYIYMCMFSLKALGTGKCISTYYWQPVIPHLMYYPILGGYPIWCVGMLKLLVLVLTRKNQTKIVSNFWN
jgi:hypothetical protein